MPLRALCGLLGRHSVGPEQQRFRMPFALGGPSWRVQKAVSGNGRIEGYVEAKPLLGHSLPDVRPTG
jgi:hypothetical protein